MPFDANGNYTLPTIYIAIPGGVIKSTQHNTPFEDVQAALNNTLCRDGRTPWTGNQNANNNKLTGLAKGTDSTDAVRMDQVATLDSETDFTAKVTVQNVDDWTSNEPVPAKQADSRYIQQGNGGNTSNSGLTYAWIDLVTESAYPRLGVTGANGTTYGFYGIAKVNALIAACLGNTNPGISGALAGTSLCVNPADGLPYLAYSGNTKIVALALDSAKVNKADGDMSALNVQINGGSFQITNTGAPGYATWYRSTATATDGVLDIYSNVGGANTNVARITADGGINILGSGTFQKNGSEVALKSDIPSLPGSSILTWTVDNVVSMSTQALPQTFKSPPAVWCQDISNTDVHYAVIKDETITTTNFQVQTGSNVTIPKLRFFAMGDVA